MPAGSRRYRLCYRGLGEADESIQHAIYPQRRHCRSRRHRKNATGVVVALHRRDDQPAGESCGRQYGDRLGRRGDRAQDHHQHRAGACRVGCARTKRKAKVEAIPAELAEAAKEAHEKLVELVAEGDDKLMEEFFEKGTLPLEDLRLGLRGAIQAERIFPVLLSSALQNIGSETILNALVEVFPHPAARGKATGYTQPDRKGDTVERKISDAEPVSIFVFKTLADPFAGRITYFKVMSGVLKNDATLTNFNRSTQERLQHIQVMQGKTATAVAELHAGDLGAVAKLKETLTGDTLGDKAAPIFYPPARMAEPSITFAIEPKTRADEDRIGQAIHKILEEDLALRFSRDPQTKEFLLAGSGQQHIEVVVAKLHKRYHVDLTLKPPKVPYRETIRAKADAEGK